ncbi:MAG: family 16 glycoside hydrolase [Rhodothermales bacterium]
MLRLFFCILLISQYTLKASAQNETTPFKEVNLANLSSFEQAANNWKIVGAAYANRDEKGAIDTRPGAGILMNAQTEDDKSHLFSTWAHADLELDLEVMMPNGSNSGLYFQSRYEIQLFDSWGRQEPAHSDIGGIYQRWNDSNPEGEKGYEGHAPSVNVARAPGLWQHLNVVFQAPRFDGSGNKTSPAKFVRVTLNGLVIHEDVALTGPTRAAAFEDNEVASAPLMIQGDHGPVAFRNIKYRTFDPAPVKLSDLSYNYYRGDFTNQMPALEDLTLVRTESIDEITSTLADTSRLFALQFEGNLEVPRTGVYTFEVVHSARFDFALDGAMVLNDRESKDVSKVGEFPRRVVQQRLTRGSHAFALTYAKGLWHSVPTALGWYVSGPGLLRTPLTASGSVPKDAFTAYQIKVSQEPNIQRNFVVHNDEKRTHAISAGFPGGLHYAYDMGNGSLLHLWKGAFIDTSTMWYQRGNQQSAVPLGSLVTRAGKPTLQVGESGSAADYRFLSYKLDDAGKPSFHYTLAGLTVHDEIKPDAENKYFDRMITVSGDAGDETVWCVLAESDTIEEVAKGRYAIDDQKMYIEVAENLTVTMKSDGDKTQLVVPVDLSGGNAQISYKLVW